MKHTYSNLFRLSALCLVLFLGFNNDAFSQARLDVLSQSQLFYSGCTLHLGQTQTGVALDKILRLNNLGNSTLSGISASNSIAAFTNPGVLNPTIAVSNGQDLNLRFSSATAGTFYNTLTINSNDPLFPAFVLTLVAVATDPVLNSMRLVINEFSNGGFGQQEYIEMVAVGVPGTCIDLRGYRIDDNSGRGSTCGPAFGISAGYLEFADHPQWARFPVGGLIVLYNPDDFNFAIGIDDPYDRDEDYVYSVPSNDQNLFTLYSVNPNPLGGKCNIYDGQGSSRSWNVIGLDDNGDLLQIVRPDGNVEHSVAYTINGSGANVDFNSVFSGQDRVFLLVNQVSQNPLDIANWTENATLGLESPGFANSQENQDWIESLRPKIFICKDPPCADTLSTFHTNAQSATTNSWNWDFNNDGSGDASVTVPFANYRFPYAGKFLSVLTIESQSGTCVLRKEKVFTAVVCTTAISTVFVDTLCVDNTTGVNVSIPFTVDGTFVPGNVFTAKLIAPSSTVDIGTLASTASGTINATIPAGTVSGKFYRIRIDASHPPATGNLSPMWTAITNRDEKSCAGQLSRNTSQVFNLAMTGQPVSVVLGDSTAEVEWYFSDISSNVNDMAPYIPARKGRWLAPSFNQPGIYFIRARIACPCGGFVFTDSMRITIQNRPYLAYQGGEDGDCWGYYGRNLAGDTVAVTLNTPLAPASAKDGIRTLTIGGGSAASLSTYDIFLGNIDNANWGVSFRTNLGNGPGLDSRENIAFDYSTDCSQNWIPAGTVGGGGDLQFDWDQSQVGYDADPGACCRTGQYSGGSSNCGFCLDNNCPACLQSVSLNPISQFLPNTDANVRMRVRTVDNGQTTIALNRGDEIIHIDDIYLSGDLVNLPTSSLVRTSNSSCGGTSIEYRAEFIGTDFSSSCFNLFEFQWFVDGTQVASDVTPQNEATRTLSGLSNQSSVWVNICLYVGANPAAPAANGCVLYQIPSVADVIDSIPAPTAVLSALATTSTFVCLPDDVSALKVELTGSAPWSISYSVNDGPDVQIDNIQNSPFEFDFSPPAAGNHRIVLTALSDRNCTLDTANGRVDITAANKPIGVDAGLDQVFCVALAATVNAPLGNVSNPAGQWDLVQGPAAASFANAPTQYINSLQSLQVGSYVVSWTQGPAGCSTEDLAYLHVYEEPTAVGSDSAYAYCGSRGILIAKDPSPGTGVWSCPTCPSGVVIATPDQAFSQVSGLSLPTVYTFVWTVSSGPCPNVIKNVMLDPNAPAGINGLWRGFIDNDWTKCYNWDDFQVPTTTTDVVLRSSSILTVLDWASIPATTVNSFEIAITPAFSPTNRIASLLQINSTLHLVEGIVKTDRINGKVQVNSNASAAVDFHSAQSYVSGLLNRAVNSAIEYDFPVGIDAAYQLATLTTDVSFAGTSRIDAQFISGPGQEVVPAPNIVKGTAFDETTAGGFWRIDPNAPLFFGSFDLKLFKSNSSPIGVEFVVVKRGAAWAVPNGPEVHDDWGLSPPNIIWASAKGYTSFSEFDIAYADQPFPLNRIELSANWASNSTAELDWRIFLDVPVRRVELQRSVRLPAFEPIRSFSTFARQGSASNSFFDFVPKEYSHFYYRLAVHTHTGDTLYSEIKDLVRDERPWSVSTDPLIYPNPTSGLLNVSWNSRRDETVKLRVLDMQGRVLFEQQYTSASGMTEAPLDLSFLADGIYFLDARGQYTRFTTRFVVNH